MNKPTLFGAGVLLAASLTLTACSSDDSAAGGSAEKVSMALVVGTKGSPFYEAMTCGAKAAATKNNVDLDVAAPDNWGASYQLPVLESVATRNPKGLLVVPTDVDALTDTLTQIKGNGSSIVELDQRTTDPSLAVSKIASDDTEGGVAAAKALAEAIGGKGKVMAISSPPGTDQQYVRVKGFKEELAKSYPDIDFIGEQYALNDVTKAAGYVGSTLASDPDLKGIFVANDINATGAVAGLKEAGKVGDVKVVAYDAAQTEVDALKDGSIQALIAQDPYGEGYQGVEQALAAVNGGAVEATIAIPLQTLTTSDPDALDEYLKRNGTC